MRGASSVSSSGGNPGGTKRKANDLTHGHSPSVEGITSGYNTLSSMSTPGSVSCMERGGSRVNGTSSGLAEGGAIMANASAGAMDGENGPQQPSTAVMKIKAEVFENDRDNFLTTFEKPTQIYKFLRGRMLESPIFLHRTLSYMNGRMSRSHNTRVGFKVDNMNKKLEDERKFFPQSSHDLLRTAALGTFQTKGPIKFFNVIVLGLTDGQLWHPDTKARVDVCVAKVCFNNKRKEDSAGLVTKVFEKRVDLKIHSPSSPKPSNDVNIPYVKNCPVVPIPVELLSLGSNGHAVKSVKLVIRVTLPRKCLQEQNNISKSDQQKNHLNSRNSYNSDTSLDEPKAKRRRSARIAKNRENFIYDGEANNKRGNGGAAGGAIAGDKLEEYIVYTGHISLYKHDIPGDKIKQGDLDIPLGKLQMGGENKISHQRVRREIYWESLDEQKHSKILEQGKPVGRCAKLCVAIRTSSEAQPGLDDPPPPLLIADLKKEIDDESSKTSLACQEMQNSVRVIYKFIYGSDNSQQQTQSRNDLRCPWCSINCMHLYSLMKHLKLCHPRYLFTFSPIPNGAKIDVAINDSYNGSYSPSASHLVCQPPGDAFARNGPTKRTEVFSILVCWPKPCKQTLQEFFDFDEMDVDQRGTCVTGHDNRLYHHTSTCVPIDPRETDVDSEEEPDPEWLRVTTRTMIDEFTDVNEGEKELMKLWNLHVLKYNYIGDCQIPFACKRFVELHGKELIQKNLYRNFCLHLTNLFDFGLLTPQIVHSTIQLLHSQMRESCPTTNYLLMRREACEARPVGHAVNELALTSETTTAAILDSSCDAKMSLSLTGGGSNDASSISIQASSPSTIASVKTEIEISNPASELTTPPFGGAHNTANNVSGGNTIFSSSSSSSSPSSSSSTPTSHMNGIGTRKLMSKDERSSMKKETYFWFGGLYNYN